MLQLQPAVTTPFIHANPVMAHLFKFTPVSKQSPALSNTSTNNTESPIPRDVNEENDSDEVCLRWNSHYSNMKKTFPSLLNMERFIDCTITTDKGTIKCHQVRSYINI